MDEQTLDKTALTTISLLEARLLRIEQILYGTTSAQSPQRPPDSTLGSLSQLERRFTTLVSRFRVYADILKLCVFLPTQPVGLDRVVLIRPFSYRPQSSVLLCRPRPYRHGATHRARCGRRPRNGPLLRVRLPQHSVRLDGRDLRHTHSRSRPVCGTRLPPAPDEGSGSHPTRARSRDRRAPGEERSCRRQMVRGTSRRLWQFRGRRRRKSGAGGAWG